MVIGNGPRGILTDPTLQSEVKRVKKEKAKKRAQKGIQERIRIQLHPVMQVVQANLATRISVKDQSENKG